MASIRNCVETLDDSYANKLTAAAVFLGVLITYSYLCTAIITRSDLI